MTPELRQARVGKLTASKAAVIMGGLDTSGLASLVKDLAWERVYGITDDEPAYQSAAMERGTLIEAQAREWYAFEADCVVDHDPDLTIDHPTIPMVAASPDGLRADRVVEIKCPLHKAWMEVKRTHVVPSEYRWQTRWQMWCSAKHACDFVAYHPAAGGLIVPCAVTAAEIEQMTERAALIETKIATWVDILLDRKAAA